jgi:hypothetical protein
MLSGLLPLVFVLELMFVEFPSDVPLPVGIGEVEDATSGASEDLLPLVHFDSGFRAVYVLISVLSDLLLLLRLFLKLLQELLLPLPFEVIMGFDSDNVLPNSLLELCDYNVKLLKEFLGTILSA